MIGAHSWRTRLVMRGCAVALEMGRCWRVRRTVNSGMGRKSKIGCFSGRGNGAPFRCSGGAVEVHWLAKYLANRVAFQSQLLRHLRLHEGLVWPGVGLRSLPTASQASTTDGFRLLPKLSLHVYGEDKLISLHETRKCKNSCIDSMWSNLEVIDLLELF